MQRLVSNMNASLIKVSADLDRLTAATPTEQCVNNVSVARCGECVYDYEITAETVFNKLEHINICKAPEPDDLPNWFQHDFGFTFLQSPCLHLQLVDQRRYSTVYMEEGECRTNTKNQTAKVC